MAEQLTGRDLSRALPTSKEVYEPRRLLPDNPIPVAPDASDLREALAKAKRGHTEQWQRYLGYLKEAVGGRPPMIRLSRKQFVARWQALKAEHERKEWDPPTQLDMANTLACAED